MMILRRPELCCSYSYSHGDDHDLAVPLEIQDSHENLQHLPLGQEKKPRKTLDEEEEVRRRNNMIRVSTPTRGCLIYKYILSGLRDETRPVKQQKLTFCIEQTIISNEEKTGKGGYDHTEWKPRLRLGGSSSSKMLTKKRIAEF
jgi:hypothetical protein